MVSTRILIDPVGLFSSISLKQKYGVPECSTTSSDRKSTRLNSSHRCISYAVFCLKKKTETARAGLVSIRDEFPVGLSILSDTYEWCSFFFFNDTATTEIYTLSLHDALPI